MDTAGICVQVQISNCAQGVDEQQGHVHASVHHVAIHHSVPTLPQVYGVFMSPLLYGGQ
jgi:hypothetical protein